MHKVIVSILRVSTTEQCVDNQKHQITEAFPDAEVHWFTEEGVSGKTPNAERPEFIKATRLAKKLGVPIVAANLSTYGS